MRVTETGRGRFRDHLRDEAETNVQDWSWSCRLLILKGQLWAQILTLDVRTVAQRSQENAQTVGGSRPLIW